jgi:AraC-like DNA-binding protein
VLRGAAPGAISEFARQRIAQHSFQTLGGAAPTGGYLHHVAFRNVSLSNLCFGADTLVEGSDALDYYYIQVVMAGLLEVGLPDRSFTVDANSVLVVNPFHRVRLHHSADCSKIIVRISKEAVHQQLAGLLGKTTSRSIEFAPIVKLDAPRIACLVRTIEHICRELEDPLSTINAGMLCKTYEDLLLDAFCTTVPHCYSSRLEQMVDLDGPECLMRVERYLAENYASEISLIDLVKASGTSQRNLYKAFKAYRDTTPMEHLKWFRLRTARQALAESNNSFRTVTDVALAVGIQHLGNFAADYKRQFGELPSDTLRRGGRLMS